MAAAGEATYYLLLTTYQVAAAGEAREWASWKEEEAPQGGESQPMGASTPGVQPMGVESALAAALHPTSMGQLLVMDYNVIKELPADLGMTVRILKYQKSRDYRGYSPSWHHEFMPRLPGLY